MQPKTRDSEIRAIAEQTSGLDCLVLFGSRARGTERPDSDWDFALLGQVDRLALLAALVDLLGTERVDLADLDRASGLLRYRVASEGRLVWEARSGVFAAFRLEAARFWCEAGETIRRASIRRLQALRGAARAEH